MGVINGISLILRNFFINYNCVMRIIYDHAPSHKLCLESTIELRPLSGIVTWLHYTYIPWGNSEFYHYSIQPNWKKTIIKYKCITVDLYIINLSLKQFFDLIDWLVESTRFTNATIIEKHFMSLTNRLWQLIQKHFFIFINNNFVTPNWHTNIFYSIEYRYMDVQRCL